jgi:hypothetical protein
MGGERGILGLGKANLWTASKTPAKTAKTKGSCAEKSWIFYTTYCPLEMVQLISLILMLLLIRALDSGREYASNR